MDSACPKAIYAIIIVDYKSLERTCQYIKSFKDACQDFPSVQFIVVDNYTGIDYEQRRKNSGFCNTNTTFIDHHGDIVEIWNKIMEGNFVWLISKNKNLGYAKANNLGIIFADKILHTIYAIFSNNDIQFPGRFYLSAMTDVFEKYRDCFILGPEIIGLDGKRQGPVMAKRDNAFRDLIRPYSLFRLWISGGITYPKGNFRFGKVHHVSGAFMMTKIHSFKQIGMFDENTFLYGEEDILSERGKKYKLYCYYDASITIIHEGGATTSPNLSMLSQQKISFQSAVYYYQNYCNANWIILMLAKINFYCIFIPAMPLIKRIYKRISYKK